MKLLFWLLALLPLVAAESTPVDFAKDVQPILRTRCFGCHGPGQQMSGLRFDRQESAKRVIQAGSSGSSLIVQRVTGLNGLPQMPPAGPKLTAAEIGTLRQWIDQGADWPAAASISRHWAFEPVRRPSSPANIDGFVFARLAKEGLTPSPEAPKGKLLRRLSLDLTGLPPTPAEIDGFLADTGPDAYARQVDRLLNSPHFGEKWARHWLDLARFADSDGYEKDWFRPWAWRYREWVINAYNQDLPFDRFTTAQIAGDLLPHATADDRIAAGFNRNTLTNREGGVDNKQFVFENTVDRASTVGTVWLGLTVGCAQCHNHKFDPISQKDFYQMFAFFDNVEEVDVDAPKPGELGSFLRTQSEYQAKRAALLAEYKVPELQPEWERRLREAAAAPGKFLDWDLAWDCVQKLTEGGDGAKILMKPAAQRTAREQDILTTHFVKNYHFAVGQPKYKELGFNVLDKKLDTLKASYPQLSQAMTVVEASAPHPTYLRVRGDYKNPGTAVNPAVPAILPQLAAGTHPTRLDLARWLVSKDNPLTARVAVNRLWQELFGQGLVKTSDDFGTRGDLPTHPELLDWLASEFRDHGWSTKALIREIVMSATYRQSSLVRPELEAKDPENKLLGRQSRLRLPAELIRDSALSVSGLLDSQIGGPSVRPPQPKGVTELGYGKREGAQWEESTGGGRYRRGLYVQFQRSTPYPELVNFDAPKSNVPVCKRERSNTSLQALNLLNDPVFVEAAEALAYRVLTEAPEQTRLNYAFRLALGREPVASESARLRTYWEQQRRSFIQNPAAAKSLLGAQVPGVDAVELAAWTGVGSVLLNLDEFITRE